MRKRNKIIQGGWNSLFSNKGGQGLVLERLWTTKKKHDREGGILMI